MGKADMTRDYYADLEISQTADITDIKKQFRKLALQYHPDRNPGREAEVNSKFQIIQSAHEILTDPEQKAKYDSSRVRPRYGGASGVKGNPWSNAGANFPPPPRRNASTRNPPPSGANKYRNFTNGVPPTAKAPPKEDSAEAKRNAWRAFENMRPSPQGKSSQSQSQSHTKPEPSQSTTGTRPVPRTPSQRQRAEAAFGTRKPGFVPRSPVPGDEPPVTARNYATGRHTSNMFSDTASGRRRASVSADPLGHAPLDSRQSTPYQTHGGEKTNPFDGVPLSRTRSTKEGSRPGTANSGANLSPGNSRQRSSSTPRSSKDDTAGAPRPPPAFDSARPNSANPPANAPRDPFSSRARAKYTPSSAVPNGTAQPNTAPNSAAAANGHDNATRNDGNAAKANGPSMYETPHPSNSFSKSMSANQSFSQPSTQYGGWAYTSSRHNISPEVARFPSTSPLSLSGDSTQDANLTPFERKQRDLLSQLIEGQVDASSPLGGKKRKTTAYGCEYDGDHADKTHYNSFSFELPTDDETFSSASPEHNRFARNSADDINTRFVHDDGANTWQFSAGSSAEDPLAKPRSQSGSRVGRRSPVKRPSLRHAKHFPGNQPEVATATSEEGFDAHGWSSKIDAQHFAPPPNQTATGSPSRPGRSNSRKVRSVKPTMGTAGLVNEDSSSSDDGDWRGRQAYTEAPSTNSPNAMDIDTPPPEPVAPAPDANGARKIPVEPSREEWRAGNAKTMKEGAAVNGVEPTPKFNANAQGSEDSEEFLSTFGDLKNVAPFAKASDGLESFGDMKLNLPFESQPAKKIHIQKVPKSQPQLDFPPIPQAPRPPPPLMISGLRPSGGLWQKYVLDFQGYVQRWDAFNAKVTVHFEARNLQISESRKTKGYGFLTSRGDDDIQEYLMSIQQDQEVRKKWTEACVSHEQRIREFMAFKERMT